jgi:hypothetical protein
MRDLVNGFRTDTLHLPALHTRQATLMMIEERVPYTYCWSPSLVPKPDDWASHINVSGFFFLEDDATTNKVQAKDLLEFLGLNRNQTKKDRRDSVVALLHVVSAVCHHGGAGTTAAVLRAGKPTIIVPFFDDQLFWGNVVEKIGAGPRPTPGKDLTAEILTEAFRVAHEPRSSAVAERIQRAILAEHGCEEAVRVRFTPIYQYHGCAVISNRRSLPAIT